MDGDTLYRLAVALAIGLVVGVERGWQARDQEPGTRTAGVRTYALSGLLGGIAGALGEATGALLPAVMFAAFAAAFTWYRLRESREEGDYSVTGVVAALTVFGLGMLAVAGDATAAAAAGIAAAALLASRTPLHGMLERLTWTELRSAILLLAMAVIGLEVLPNRAVDPWGGVNPWEIWFFTVLTASISFAGYIASRLIGPRRGVLVSGLIGAIVSSTAVTVAFARRAKGGEDVRALAAGGVLAAMISALRVFVLVAVVQPQLITWLVAPIAAAALMFAAIGAWLLFGGGRHEVGVAEPKLGNPFDIGPLLLFAVAFAVVAAASSAFAAWLGPAGASATTAVSGIFDVDVAALTAARLAGDAVPLASAAGAILLAILLNGGARVVAAAAVGPLRYWLTLLAASAAAATAGIVAWLVAG